MNLAAGIRIFCTLFVTLYVFASSRQILAGTAENEGPAEFPSAEESHLESGLENLPRFVDVDDEQPLFKAQGAVQFKTAEIADAMLGTEQAASSQLGLLSLIPGDAEADSEAGDATTCKAHETLASLAQSFNEDSSEETEIVRLGIVHAEENNATETAKTPKVNCAERNVTVLDSLAVQILNASQDLMEFLNANGSECSLVLFYTTWCHFSATLGPHFNALPRVFPSMHFLALDASQHSSLSTRFGTVAVPNILLFQGVKPMARFNQTERTLGTLKAFIMNQTGVEGKAEEEVTEEDLSGPLPSVPVRSIDWLLVFSIMFITGFVIYAVLRTDSIRWLMPGQEHEHQD
ncbi:thioredoxin domain-containing protein 15-like [Acipenser ruthenus]|uniref:thioredoxin domain-containing protein 15-like n=1 Tax=Acipenser ruthenus TaxID=7906 RepID=UPI00145B2AFC|nr:thioredoxin domain-containing protein 15-like [Acipenser ruthenus]